MKAPPLIPGLLTAILLCCLAPNISAQTSAGLNVQTYAGLTITGVVGMVYTVQSTTNVALSNEWRAVGIVQLASSPYLWVDTTAPVTGRRFYRAVGGPTNLAWIPPGNFTMGSPTNEPDRYFDERPQTLVTISRGFFMGKYEVTQSEYLAVMGSNPSNFKGDLLRPVELVSWNDAVSYCTTLTTREHTAGRLPVGYAYRLPTEGEWEYACRAGTTTAFHYGAALRSGMANFDGRYEYPSCDGITEYCYNPAGTYLGRTTTVGSYAPNAWGLYDMHGNVWEWCSDWWSSSLPGGSVTDPQGVPAGQHRVIRGGSWIHGAVGSRSAIRNDYFADDWRGVVGFRVVLAPDQP